MANGASEQSCPQEWHDGKGQWDQSPIPRLMPAHTLQQGKAAHAFWEYHLAGDKSTWPAATWLAILLPFGCPHLPPHLYQSFCHPGPSARASTCSHSNQRVALNKSARTQTSPASPDAA